MNWSASLRGALRPLLPSVTAQALNLPALNAAQYRDLVQRAERDPWAAIDADRYEVDFPEEPVDAISALRCHPALKDFLSDANQSDSVQVIGLSSGMTWPRPDELIRYLLARLVRSALASGVETAVERIDHFLGVATGDLPGFEATFVVGLRLDGPWRIADGARAISYDRFERRLPAAALPVYSGMLSERNPPRHLLFVLLRECEWGPAIAAGSYSFSRPRFRCPDDALAITDSLALAVGQPLPIIGQSTRADRWIYRWLGPCDLGMYHPRPGIDITTGDRDSEVPPQQLRRFADLYSAQLGIAKQHKRRIGLAVSRLASALGRRGTLAEEDVILDVAIALEVLYRPSGPVAETLSSRAAWFLGKGVDERCDIRKTIKNFYHLRSKLAHGKNIETAREESKAAFDIARRTLLRYSTDGAIPSEDDWNRIVMGEP